MDYEIIRINRNSWRVEDSGVRFILLVGTERALLVDSGRNVRNARDIAASLTDLPILLVNTHADRDHVASNCQFESFYMHPAEESNFCREDLPGKKSYHTVILILFIIDVLFSVISIIVEQLLIIFTTFVSSNYILIA